MSKAIIFTYIPSPYRTIVFDELNQLDPAALSVVYISKGDPKFDWKIKPMKHEYVFLEEWVQSKGTFFRLIAIWKFLSKKNPSVVITCGFTLPMLCVMLWAFVFRRKRIVNTDAWTKIENAYSKAHKLIRKWIYPTVHAAIPVSEKGYEMFRAYGIRNEKIFISSYAIDNDRYARYRDTSKQYDIMFSGQFIDRKMPFFFADVARGLKEKNPAIKVLILGSGELKDSFFEELNRSNICFDYPGFIQPSDLPQYYASSKLLLFPTQSDSWGVVANDAMAAGTPVITCRNAGCADELVEHEKTGWVLPLESSVWVEVIHSVLSNPRQYQEIRKNAMERVSEYHPKKSAERLIDALSYVLLHK
jgi:glycosyltransferase involved in cell wall biosynthesis